MPLCRGLWFFSINYFGKKYHASEPACAIERHRGEWVTFKFCARRVTAVP